MKMENSRDLSRKLGSLHCKKLHLICGENDVKGPHAEGLKFGKLQEASGSNRGMNWAGLGPGRSAQASRPKPAGLAHSEPGSPPPLTYPLLCLFKVPTPRLTYQFIHHPPPRRREARGTPSRTGGSC
ncbi:hypothetical protein PAHAL_3G264300 [Panicum hallii]|uniref:Uncharacterized protein n=1 Tax=Panicum hallii TaxID=206008 RepID=A0A2T8KJF6_9POAL|nr:hypothetical protein PAHAL_3G264300 [Panicum hallii]